LDFEQFFRVIEFADRVDQPVRHIHLVEDGQLDRDTRQFGQRRQGQRRLTLVFHVKINKVIAVPAIDGQDAEHEEVKNED